MRREGKEEGVGQIPGTKYRPPDTLALMHRDDMPAIKARRRTYLESAP